MEAEQSRIQADLRGQIDGDVLCDDFHRSLYASDASLYELMPTAIVRPRHSGDVERCVRYAAENQLTIFPRGGGTGLAGQSLGRGLILDFSRYMRRLMAVDVDAQSIRVQPGMVLAELNRSLAKSGLIFGPDPAARAVTTMGSVIAVDAQGSHFPRYGSAGDCVSSLEAVIATGESVTLSRRAWQGVASPRGMLQAITSEIGQLLDKSQPILQKPLWDKSLRGTGFRLEKCINESWVDLARLQSGAEGTLAVITEATLRVERIPAFRGVVLLFFDRMESAAKCAADIAAMKTIAACDLMDRRLIELARETDSRYDRYLHRGSEAMLLVECQGEEASEVRNKLAAIVAKTQRKYPSMVASRVTSDSAERDFLWRLCRRVIQRLYRVKGADRPVPGIEDICVPTDRLAEFLLTVQNIFKSYRITATVFAHAAHGHLHIRPFIDLSDASQRSLFDDLAREIYETVIQMRGTVAGETSFGLSRSWLARQQLGDRYPIHRRIKELFDPTNLFNPGKLIGDNPQRLTDNLRKTLQVSESTLRQGRAEDAATRTARLRALRKLDKKRSSNAVVVKTTDANANGSPRVPGQDSDAITEVINPRETQLPILDWQGLGEIAEVANACNGCGRCRTTADNERMCPMFRLHAGEEASPRAKANLTRAWLANELPKQAIAATQMKEIADLCFHCHQCRIDCPASVDVPRMMTEIKAQYVAANGLNFSDQVLSRLDRVASLANRFPKTANWALENRWCRWIFEKLTGIASSRKLPSIANQTFVRWATKRRITRTTRTGGRKVLLFADQYINWHNPLLGIAAVEILQRNRTEVYVPPFSLNSYMAKIVMGDVERARKLLAPQIQQLAEAIRMGYQIVGIEPSTVLCLTREYPFLFDTEEAHLIAQNTTEIGRYLWDMHQLNELDLGLSPLPLSVMYHLPCHLRAIDPDQPGLQLLKLIPALQVFEADAGCSGMAGTFGLKRDNFRTSLRIGWPLIGKMQSSPVQIGSTECSTCKLQMEQAVEQPTIPPIALLAYSYGLLPQVGDWINRRNYGLTVL